MVLYAIPLQTSDNSFVTRVDWTINGKNNLYARYFLDGYQQPAFFYPNNILVTTQAGLSQRVQSFTIGEAFTISSRTVNTAHLTVMRRRNNRGYAANAINAGTPWRQSLSTGAERSANDHQQQVQHRRRHKLGLALQ